MVLDSCENEIQFGTAINMFNNFVDWKEFWKNKWKPSLFRWGEYGRYLDWVEDIDDLAERLSSRIQRIQDYISKMHDKEQTKTIVVLGFEDLAPEKENENHE